MPALKPRPTLTKLMDLRGRVAIVTGAAQGFGFACAERLSEAGAEVLLADVNSEAVNAAAERLAQAGRSVHSCRSDISIPAQVEEMCETARSCFATADILVNNAGVFSNALLEDLSVDEFQRIVDVNLRGTFLCTRSVARGLRQERKSGSIINITSIDSLHPTGPGLSHYGSSKHAIWGFTKAMALELGPDDIRVNAIAPGPSATEGAVEFVTNSSPDGVDVAAQWGTYERRIPLGRLADPDEIGLIAVFLASEMASYVTGAQIVADGGFLAT